MTQMHALNAMDFCALLEREPALSLFYKHFRTWGCWQRLSRALTLNGARLVPMARLSADGAGDASLKAWRPTRGRWRWGQVPGPKARHSWGAEAALARRLVCLGMESATTALSMH